MSKGSLRFRSTAEMPDGMRKLVEAQSATAARIGAPTPMRRLSIAEAIDPAPRAEQFQRARHVKHTTGEMNKTEARYAQHLDALVAAGAVVAWKFESVKIRLAKRTWLTIDFFVWLPDGRIELHEVKGRKGARYFATEDSKLKVKVAAEEYPLWTVRIVWPAKGGGWDQEKIG